MSRRKQIRKRIKKTGKPRPPQAEEKTQAQESPHEEPQETPHEEPQEEPQKPEEQEEKGEEGEEGEEEENEQPGGEFGNEIITAPPPVRIPLISSHYYRGRVRTAGLCITPNSCKVVSLSSKNTPNIGAEHTALSHRPLLFNKGLQEHHKTQIGELVKRARHGDQNAMAVIALARDNAAKGLRRAQSSIAMMHDFIKRNPVKQQDAFGAESPEPVNIDPDTKGGIMLANGPPITKRRIYRICITLPSEEARKLFLFGLTKWSGKHHLDHVQIAQRLNSAHTDILSAGRTVGFAKAIQMLRDPNIPISVVDKNIGWELGE